MSRPRRARFVALADLLARVRPDVDASAVAAGRVLVDGSFVTNPFARVRRDAALRVLPVRRLRGEIKLTHALSALHVPVRGRVAVDVGASAGGFTTALLAAGARRVYAVDAGIGQLVGRLRADPRVVNLECCNLASLSTELVPEPVGVITVDLSYLALAAAVPQLAGLDLDADADLVALVKPTFELGRARLASTDEDVAAALARATCATEQAGWRVCGSCPAPRTGRRGAREVFIRARRVGGPPGPRASWGPGCSSSR